MKFFIPLIKDCEAAYQHYWNQYEPVEKPDGSRLFSISFYSAESRRVFVAEVGKELFGWPEKEIGPVLAILESQKTVRVLTQLKGGLFRDAICVHKDDIRSREYFEDYPKAVSGDPT